MYYDLLTVALALDVLYLLTVIHSKNRRINELERALRHSQPLPW